MSRRKDLTDKAAEKATPDSQKSVLDKASESATGAYDKAAGAVQPSDDKSVTQNVSDSLGGTAKPGEKGYVEQAQEVLGNAAKTVQDTATDLYNKAADSANNTSK